MTEEIIIDKEDKTKKHRNNEIDCLHFSCRKGESGKVLLWCDFYDALCDNYTGCYYRKYLRLEQENKELKTCIEMIKNTEGQAHIEGVRLAKENKELKEWKDKVVKLFESACRCKYLNEEKDICSYTNEKCININKCVYKYQELSDIYRSALEEIREIAKFNQFYNPEDLLINGDIGQIQDLKMTEIYNKINEVLQ